MAFPGTAHVLVSSPLPNGGRVAAGKFEPSANYQANGIQMDLSSYFPAGEDVMVMLGGETSGYVFVHDDGNATNGKVKIYCTGAGDGAALAELNAAVDLSALNVPFVALGLQV